MAEDFDIEALLEAPYNNVSTISMNDVQRIHNRSFSIDDLFLFLFIYSLLYTYISTRKKKNEL